MRALTVPGIREYEQRLNESGTSFYEMMQTAGSGIAANLLNISPCGPMVFLCGNGKNGGDGFVAAGILAKKGIEARVLLCLGEPKDELAKTVKSEMPDTVKRYEEKDYEAALCGCKVIVDCVFGIGFRGDLPESIKKIFRLANSQKAVRIAVDLPSGISGNGDDMSEDTFSADETLTMIAPKPGLLLYPTSKLCGKITVIPLTDKTPADGYIEIPTDKEITEYIPKRHTASNKGDYGKLGVICGSPLMPGAAELALKGAIYSGCGLVCFYPTDGDLLKTIQNKLPEPVYRPYKSPSELAENIGEQSQTLSAIVIGCGLGVTDDTKKLVRSVILNSKCPVILDADGLNCIADEPGILLSKASETVITPHPGEMSRLCGKSVSEINKSRIGTASEFAKKYGVTVLLKGHGTIITDGEKVYENPTGNDGMARGGSGDLLSGIIGSFVAQGAEPFSAAVAGAFIHGRAGDLAARELTAYGCTPSKFAEYIPAAFKSVIK